MTVELANLHVCCFLGHMVNIRNNVLTCYLSLFDPGAGSYERNSKTQ